MRCCPVKVNCTLTKKLNKIFQPHVADARLLCLLFAESLLLGFNSPILSDYQRNCAILACDRSIKGSAESLSTYLHMQRKKEEACQLAWGSLSFSCCSLEGILFSLSLFVGVAHEEDDDGVTSSYQILYHQQSQSFHIPQFLSIFYQQRCHVNCRLFVPWKIQPQVVWV